jgi:hypothetical protein
MKAQFKDNGITYDTLVHRIPSDTDTVSFYRVVAVGKDYHSYFTVNNGIVTKVYVTERGDTFLYPDYNASVESLTFNVKLHNVQRSMEAHDTIQPAIIKPLGDTRSAYEYLEIPDPIKEVDVHSDFNMICEAAIIPIMSVIIAYYFVKFYPKWIEFGSKFIRILTT